MRVHISTLVALLALAGLAAGCTLTQALLAPRVRDCGGFDVPLNTLAVSARKELRVQVFARGVDHSFPFVAESSADSLVIVGFTPLGTKSFTLERHGDDVKVENMIGPALVMPPRNVMADVLAMSVPSTCSTTPDGVAVSAAGTWQLSDTCKDGRPLLRHIRKPEARPEDEPEVEVEYRDDMIVVRQKHCRYAARYVLQAAPAAAPAPPQSLIGAGAGSAPPR